MAHRYKITYANGDTATISHNGSADELFEQLFSACSKKIRATCSVEEAKEEKAKTAPSNPLPHSKQMQPAASKPAATPTPVAKPATATATTTITISAPTEKKG